MHEYRRFIQHQLDERGWKQSVLVKESGLSRQLIHSILSDKRDHLGQMPDDSTIAGLAKGFGLPERVIRHAAARSLVGYADSGEALTVQLQDVSTDALLNEIRRRIDAAESQPVRPAAPAGASTEGRSPEEDPPGDRPGSPNQPQTGPDAEFGRWRARVDAGELEIGEQGAQ